MKHRMVVALFLVVGLLSAGLVGCGEEKGATLSKEDESKLHAAPGQPMPAEAKAFMEKANKDAQDKAAAAAGAGATGAAGKPAGATAPPATPPK